MCPQNYAIHVEGAILGDNKGEFDVPKDMLMTSRDTRA